MQPEVEELRPKLKEILYDCAVEIRATKAALYVFDGSSRFELVTEFGFRGGVRQTADMNDPIVDRCGRGRTPFYVNGIAVEPRFSPMMFESSTDRLLVAPLYSRGKLVGLIDMRDKAAKAPFEQADVQKAQSIADRLVELFVDKNIFGHRFITLSNMGAQAEAEAAASASPEVAVQERPPAPAPAPVAPRPAPPLAAPPMAQPPRTHVPRLATLVIEARTQASRIVIAPVPESIGEKEFAAAKELLRSILLIPGAVTATFSAFGHLGGMQEIAAQSTLAEDAKNVLQSKLNMWLSKRGEAGGFVRTSVSTPLGTSGPPVTAANIQKVFTAPLTVGSMRGLYLTVAFGGNPDRTAHELLAVLHANLQLVIEHSMQSGTIGSAQSRIAEYLLEPDFSKYPELRRHSTAVASLAEKFARYLALTPAEVEQVRIVGLVHDVGMRLLEYDRLYRKKDLTQEELAFLREHATVGAAMVEPLLGTEIARAVLCHHERVDGHGYPNELHGEEIPLLSRVVQICDAWLAITDPEGYQVPESPATAVTTMARGGGAQFDAGLCTRFLEMLRQR